MEKIQKENCNVIRYNNDVIKDKNTNIIIRTLIDKKTSQSISVFLLKYEFDGKPYEVVLGKLQLDKGDGSLSDKAKIVKECIERQLNENNKGRNNCEVCKSLDNVCVKKGIHFEYTDEGIKIVTNSVNNFKKMERTYLCNEENNILNLRCLKPEKRMDLYISEANLRKSIEKNIKQNKVIDAAKSELDSNNFEKFDVGKNLKEFQEIQSEDIRFDYKNELIKYLIEWKLEEEINKKNKDEQSRLIHEVLKKALQIKRYCREKENREVQIDRKTLLNKENNEKSLEEKYFRLKEKGIVIDIKKLLEQTQKDCLKNVINVKDISEEKVKECLALSDRIDMYNKIFDAIKQGGDIMSQFWYMRLSEEKTVKPEEKENEVEIEKITDKKETGEEEKEEKREGRFIELKALIENQIKKEKIDSVKAKEIMDYLEMKEEVLGKVRLLNGNDFFKVYEQNDKVKNLIKYTIQTESRASTLLEEKKILSEVYDEMIDVLILKHEDSVKLYNEYANRFGAKTCEIPGEYREVFVEENSKRDDGESIGE